MLIPYEDEKSVLEGFAAFPEKEKSPLVILCHAWRGRDDFICEKAKLMAHWGYVGFALDMYGKGVVGKSKEENAALKKPFIQDRALLLRRAQRGLDAAFALSKVDTKKIAVVGFGFGGICALDLARSGAPLKGAVTVYGHFEPPPHLQKKSIHAKILALHGYLDPIVSSNELHAFEEEMNEAKVDWQVHLYGKAMHAFVTPSAQDPASGLLFDPIYEKRAWRAIQSFLEEIFS
ncbi:MAG TPA: dienelactone hydrolase family protein [Rhabdochlamydiaceae bacterium]|nr:dienelactone hydrolase family protein [Rhabdochlamydiaceae bacterium]